MRRRSHNKSNAVGLSVMNHAPTLDGKYQQGREIPCHFPAYTKKVFIKLITQSHRKLVSKLDV